MPGSDERIGIIIETTLEGNAAEQATKGVQDFEKASAKAAQGVTSNFSRMSAAQKAAGNATQQFSKTAVNASGSLIALNRVVQDAPFGFIAIQNNMTELFQNFGQLIKQAGGTGNALKIMAGSMLGAGGVTFALSAVTSLMTAAIQKYGSFSAAIVNLLGLVNNLERAQSEYNKAVRENTASAQGEISMINALIQVARDENVTRQQRNAAIKEIQKQYPGYLKNIDAENINSKEAAAAIDLLTESLLRKAKIQGAQDQISKEFSKLLDAQTADIIGQVKWYQLLGAAAKAAGSGLNGINSALASGVKNQANAVASANQNIKSFQNTLNALLKEEALDKVIGIGEKGKKTKTIADVLKEMAKEMEAITQRAALLGLSIDDLSSEKIGALNKAFDDIAKIGGPAARKELEKLAKAIEVMSGAFIGTEKLEVKELFTFDKKNILDKATGLTNETLVIRVPRLRLAIDPQEVAKGIGDAQKLLVDGIQVMKNNILPEVVDLTNVMESALQQGAAQLAIGLGELAGGLLSGQTDLAGALKGVIGLLADFVSNLGKALIAAGTATLAARVLSTNPFGAIAAGVLAVAAAAAIKGAMNSAPSFATEGTAIGPQLAVIGDNAARREHVLSDQTLKDIASGGGGQQGLALRMEGTQLVIFLERVKREMGR